MLKLLNLKREYGLVAAAIIVLFASYQLAFKKTVSAWGLHSNLEHQLSQSADLSYQPGYLERKNNNLDRIIHLYDADTINFRSNIIGTISSMAEQENVKLAEVPSQDPFYHTQQFIVQKLTFEGDYFALEKTLNRLQSASQIGVVRGTTLRTVAIHSHNDDTKKIVMEVYLEIATN